MLALERAWPWKRSKVNTQAFGRDEGKNCDLRVFDPNPLEPATTTLPRTPLWWILPTR